MSESIRSLKNRIASVFKAGDTVMRHRAVEILEHEIQELENIFGLLVFGSFVGIPAPPAHLTMALFPLMETELATMLDKVSTAYDPLGELFSIFDIC